LSGQLPERSSGWQKAQNRDESTDCRNGKSGVQANAPRNWSVSYKRLGLTHGRHSNDETVSNLTRRRKAGRLQDGIDRYLPISGHGECTVTRCWRESSAHRRGCAHARAVERGLGVGIDVERIAAIELICLGNAEPDWDSRRVITRDYPCRKSWRPTSAGNIYEED
jgi:hypothetical protein